MILCLFVFRIAPTVRLWQHYNVVFIDIDCDIDFVRTQFLAANIENVLYPDHDNFPVASPLYSVQMSDSFGDFTYGELQNAYFLDRDKNYRIYYVPDEYEKTTEAVLKTIPYDCGIDSQATLPFIPPLVAFAFSLILFFSCKNKAFFLSLQFPFILYCIAIPFYHSAAFVCLWGFSIFIMQKYRNRRFFIRQLFKNFFLPASFVFLFLSSFVFALHGILLFLSASILSACLLYVYTYRENLRYKNNDFQPILIHSAKTVSTGDVFNIRFICTLGIFLIFLAILASMNIHSYENNTHTDLHIPGISEYTVTDNFSLQAYETVVNETENDRLPDLTDFINAAWYMEVLPYIKLGTQNNHPILPGETVSYSTYIKNGYRLEERIETVAVFDDTYIADLFGSVAQNIYAGAEKLLISQEGFFRVHYTATDGYKAPVSSLIFTFLACIYGASLFIYLNRMRRCTYGR